jgi:hypothetical protein
MKRFVGWMILVVVGIVLVTPGCRYQRRRGIFVLRESEQYYYIPAGTPFMAVVEKGKPPVQVIRTVGTWAVDAGYLHKLQTEANARVLEPPE